MIILMCQGVAMILYGYPTTCSDNLDVSRSSYDSLWLSHDCSDNLDVSRSSYDSLRLSQDL